MLEVNYNYTSSFSAVEDLTSFYKETLEEIPKIRSFINTTKLIFALPTDRITVEVAEGERVYKINLLMPNVRKTLFGWFVYMPLKNRLDLYSIEDPTTPIFQWKNKKLVFSSMSVLFMRAGIDKLFNKLVNII